MPSGSDWLFAAGARFTHDASRELDPQLHTHAMVINATRRADGQWRALSSKERFRAKMLVINGNVLVNDTPGAGIVMESVQDVTVSNNDFRWNVPAAALGVYLRSTIRPADGVMISANRFAGNLLAAVFFGATQPFNQVSLIGNMQRGSGLALKCSTSTGGGFAQPIVHASNNWTGGIQCSAATPVPQRP